jgi:hypothetical protein
MFSRKTVLRQISDSERWTKRGCNNVKRQVLEELIEYFRVIRHGPHRKRSLQIFFVAAEHLHWVLNWQRYDDTQTNALNNSSMVAYILCWGNLFTEPLPSNERRDTLYRCFTINNRRDTYTEAQTDVRDSWSTELRCVRVPWYTYQVFIKIFSGFQKLIRKDSQTHREYVNRIRILLFFSKKKESKLKNYCPKNVDMHPFLERDSNLRFRSSSFRKSYGSRVLALVVSGRLLAVAVLRRQVVPESSYSTSS